MKLLKVVAGIGLAFSLALLAQFAQAQTSGTEGGPPAGASEGAMQGAAGSAGASAATRAQEKATELTQEINKAKAQGKDVSAAEAHQKRGEKALESGNEAAAMRHFGQAERSLGMANGGETGGAMGGAGAGEGETGGNTGGAAR